MTVAIILMLFAIIIVLLGISLKLDSDSCKHCPNFFDMNNNSTSRITVDISSKRDCIERYPEGYYHSIINNKCTFIIWTSDLTKRSLNE